MLSIVTSVFNDYDGIYFTAQSLKMYHDCSKVELVVVDNKPDSPMAGQIQKLCQFWSRGTLGAKYVPMASPTGTSPPRERAIQEATQPYVAALDSHVLLARDAVKNLMNIFKTGLYDNDLLTGPILLDDQHRVMTHFDDVWRAQMWGIWGSAWICDCSAENEGVKFSIQPSEADKRLLYFGLLPGYVPITTCGNCGKKLPVIPYPSSNYEEALQQNGYRPLGIGYDEPPFEIAGQGLGFFAFKKSSWPGFNINCAGFGGEEMYIHTKYRMQGGRCLSFPSVKWLHRFGRPSAGSYMVSPLDKARNYVLEFEELGLDLTPIYNHFVGTKALTEEQWQWMVEDPINRRGPKTVEQKTIVEVKSLSQTADLEELYNYCRSNPRDLDQHFEKIAHYASLGTSVIELSKRQESTVALLRGLPKEGKLYSFNTEGSKDLYKRCTTDPRLHSFDVSHTYQLVNNRQNLSAIQPKFDLLFVDAIHTYAAVTDQLMQYASMVDTMIFHDTHLYGENGEDGSKGILPALREFMRDNPEWTMVYHTTTQYGLSVLSRRDDLKHKLPSVITMAANFSKAVAAHTADGLKTVDTPTYENRLSICSMCEQRTNNSCAVCGCGLAMKASWRTSECPLGKWSAQS